MSQRKERSATSQNSETARAWEDVVRLGQTIVGELGLVESTDTLGRWMAHRLAELMNKAETANSKRAREEARKAVSDLIVSLWDQRASWPEGWPPRVAAALAGLAEGSSRYPRREDSTGSRWLDSLSDLDRLQARERKIWTDLGLLDFDIESERRAMKELIGDEATEEREAIERVILLWESAEQGMRDSLGAETASPAARAAAGVERLKELDSEREQLREGILKQVADSEGDSSEAT